MRNSVENDVKFLIGDTALENLMFELRLNGCKTPMLVCDDMANRLGYKRELFRAVDGSDCDLAYIDQKIADIATIDDVERIARAYVAGGCDCIIGLGRKAVVQTTKCAKVLLREGVSNLSHYDDCPIGKYPVRDVPLFLVPTNFASGSECSDTARVYDTKRNKIYSFDTSYASTQVVVVDKRMTDIVPPKAIASYGLCAFAMACAGYLYESQVFSKPYAEAAIELLNDTLIPCIVHNADRSKRTSMMAAVVLAGCGYGNLHKHLLTEMTDAISDRYRINYNNVFAILFRQYVRLHDNAPQLMSELLASLIGEHECAMCTRAGRPAKTLETIEQVYANVSEVVDYHERLSTMGVERSHFAALAQQVIATHGDKSDPEAAYSFLSQWLERCY